MMDLFVQGRWLDYGTCVDGPRVFIDRRISQFQKIQHTSFGLLKISSRLKFDPEYF